MTRKDLKWWKQFDDNDVEVDKEGDEGDNFAEDVREGKMLIKKEEWCKDAAAVDDE